MSDEIARCTNSGWSLRGPGRVSTEVSYVVARFGEGARIVQFLSAKTVAEPEFLVPVSPVLNSVPGLFRVSHHKQLLIKSRINVVVTVHESCASELDSLCL